MVVSNLMLRALLGAIRRRKERDMDFNTYEIVSMITIIVLVAIMGGTVFWCRKVIGKVQSEHQDLQQRCKKLNNNFRLITSGAIGVSDRIDQVEMTMQDLTLRHDKAAVRQSDVSSYAHAKKIAAMGGSIEDIIEACGLTIKEAKLIHTLYERAALLGI